MRAFSSVFRANFSCVSLTDRRVSEYAVKRSESARMLLKKGENMYDVADMAFPPLPLSLKRESADFTVRLLWKGEGEKGKTGR